ncbi:IPT/TIG domain-containing protein [Nocardia abscessus]|uniref:IPT/TIG domain-containing protein n=1 Tax=Nocardia abscessus TaxID=120957 RepID=UPI002458E160|nr:IPT/TIG domain-containing protein [Nocardia abscessus]
MAPTIASVSPTSGPVLGGNSVTVTGTGFTGPTTVRFGTTATTFTLDSTTQITAISPGGTGTVQVTVTTLDGTSNGLPYTFAAVAVPVLSSVSPNQGPTSGANTVTLNGTNFAGATAVRFGNTAASFTVVSGTQITAIAPAGTGTVPVTVTTATGTSNGISYTYATVPALTSIAPSSGPPTGGNTVTLTGTNLAGATAVRFGNTAASFTVVSGTQITAIAPAGTGTVPVTVTTATGTSNGISYTYATVPAVSGVSPNQGPTSGGNTVTLTGTGLTGATAVHFGATAASAFTVVSATQITAVVPAGGAGPVNVTVTTPGGTSTLASSYFYRNVPNLTGAAPASGPLAGGNTVTLTGTHLAGATAVRFGATAAGAFTVVSDTQITATAPGANAGPTDITVITAGGTSNPVSYTYLMAPTITGLSPNQGPLTGGNTVTVTGANLAQTATVLFGTTPAAFTVISDNQIVTHAPPGAAGPTNVTASTPGGTSTTAIYTRVPPPAI